MSNQNDNNSSAVAPRLYPGRINLARALYLRAKGFNNTEIARQFGVKKQAVSQQFKRLEHILLTKEEAKEFDEYVPGLLKGAFLEFVRTAVDPMKLKKASSRDLMVSAGIAATKLQELQGKKSGEIFRGFMVKAQKDGLELTIQSLSGPAPEPKKEEPIEVEQEEEEPKPEDPHGVSQ